MFETSYSDPENIGNFIVDAYNLASILVTKKDYKNAKRIFDLIIFTTYSVFEDDTNDILSYTISDIVLYDLVDIDLNRMFLTVLYITLVISDNKCKDIFNYYTLHMFDNIKVEDSFQIDKENLKDLDIFWKNWIKYLSRKEGRTAYRLLLEALEYNNYDNYREVLELSRRAHPDLYLVVFNYLEKLGDYKEIIDIGNSVLDDINDNIKAQIALLIATSYRKIDSNYDISEYLYKAFLSSHSISNIIRIINNDYWDRYRKEIDSIKDDLNNYDKDFLVMHYFLGEFEIFFEFINKNDEYLDWSYTRMSTYVKLMAFLLCNEDVTNIKKELASYICFEVGVNDNYNLYNADDRGIDFLSILNVWKKHIYISDDIRDKYVALLEDTIDRRVYAILSNKCRELYYEAAFLVCILDECLENLKIKNKGEIIDLYENKYFRFIAFNRELNKYK